MADSKKVRKEKLAEAMKKFRAGFRIVRSLHGGDLGKRVQINLSWKLLEEFITSTFDTDREVKPARAARVHEGRDYLLANWEKISAAIIKYSDQPAILEQLASMTPPTLFFPRVKVHQEAGNNGCLPQLKRKTCNLCSQCNCSPCAGNCFPKCSDISAAVKKCWGDGRSAQVEGITPANRERARSVFVGGVYRFRYKQAQKAVSAIQCSARRHAAKMRAAKMRIISARYKLVMRLFETPVNQPLGDNLQAQNRKEVIILKQIISQEMCSLLFSQDNNNNIGGYFRACNMAIRACNMAIKACMFSAYDFRKIIDPLAEYAGDSILAKVNIIKSKRHNKPACTNLIEELRAQQSKANQATGPVADSKKVRKEKLAEAMKKLSAGFRIVRSLHGCDLGKRVQINLSWKLLEEFITSTFDTDREVKPARAARVHEGRDYLLANWEKISAAIIKYSDQPAILEQLASKTPPTPFFPRVKVHQEEGNNGCLPQLKRKTCNLCSQCNCSPCAGNCFPKCSDISAAVKKCWGDGRSAQVEGITPANRERARSVFVGGVYRFRYKQAQKAVSAIQCSARRHAAKMRAAKMRIISARYKLVMRLFETPVNQPLGDNLQAQNRKEVIILKQIISQEMCSLLFSQDNNNNIGGYFRACKMAIRACNMAIKACMFSAYDFRKIIAPLTEYADDSILAKVNIIKSKRHHKSACTNLIEELRALQAPQAPPAAVEEHLLPLLQ